MDHCIYFPFTNHFPTLYQAQQQEGTMVQDLAVPVEEGPDSQKSQLCIVEHGSLVQHGSCPRGWFEQTNYIGKQIWTLCSCTEISWKRNPSRATFSRLLCCLSQGSQSKHNRSGFILTKKRLYVRVIAWANHPEFTYHGTIQNCKLANMNRPMFSHGSG